MKNHRVLTAFAVTLPLFAASCGEGSVNASDLVASAAEKVEGLDLSDMSTGDMSSKVSDLAGELVQKLCKIKDEAGAKSAAADLGPLTDQLGALKQALGDKMPALGSLSTAVESLTTKFGADSEVMKVLKPLLEKLSGLAA